jgi:hypothetical protein
MTGRGFPHPGAPARCPAAMLSVTPMGARCYGETPMVDEAAIDGLTTSLNAAAEITKTMKETSATPV